MFDIGFWEITLIAVVALIVVGPDRFPGLVRSVGRWVGQFRRVVGSVKTELEREMDKAEQLKTLMDEQVDIVKHHEQLAETKSNDKSNVPVPRAEPVQRSELAQKSELPQRESPNDSNASVVTPPNLAKDSSSPKA